MDSSLSQVARILYKEIVAGDRRKADAESNDTASGGGARDFRFPYEAVLPVVEKIFPEKIQKRGKTVHQGTFFWHEPGIPEPVSRTAQFMSPTKSRASEGWISQVPKFSCFDSDRIPIAGATNRVLLLLIQLHDETVWPWFAEENTLRIKGAWDPLVAQEILSCLDAKRAANKAVIGYIDFTNAGKYCNGK
ncbi:hypothetical protein [Ralstonia pseudosolanacearum]|uniref:hypothetical protein n=1 Tax=Ralstonia pseudosolanacearum TaxID=1310165 RepID=UPI002675FC3A|nr:hypothetical protein [Ralstonia pseudosolanacearum]MDO3560690.1 hypothetical protein [Ralstonia pseudosolanacearum]MDO3570025.1 hypothetical protein [Ralstonia pseudosolanacearum]